MSDVYVVIDVGCHECGIESKPIGIYRTSDEAATAKADVDRHNETRAGRLNWRDGGQAIVEVFPMELPS